MIRTVLVDDEPPARRKLGHLLAALPDVAVVGEAGSGAEAVEVLERERPDLVLLDIQLPDCTGLDVVDALKSRDGLHIVFVTAFDQFALQAFEIHALDYLLKPVAPERFAQSMERARQVIEGQQVGRLASRIEELSQQLRASPKYARRLMVEDGGRSLFLEVSGIVWIESARNYSCIHWGGRTYTLRSSLEALAAKLDPAVFRRINRSEIVNVAAIAEVRPWFHGDQKVVLTDGSERSWSRRYRSMSLEEIERA